MNYSKAPYNFIPLSNRVFTRYSDIDSLPAHNEILKDSYTGTIEYTINCESDLIVSDGNGHFFKDTDGNYAIPGSSVRGMIRNNIMTLGFCSVIDDIENDKYLYRRFAAKLPNIEGMDTKNLNREYTNRLGMKILKSEEGKSYSILENVKAGYIKCTGDEEYEIVSAENINNNQNYLRIGEKVLRDKGKDIKGIKYMYLSNGKLDRNGYSPYCISNISFDLNESNKYIKEIKQNDDLKFKGTLISSGPIFKKQAHYIINKKSKEEPIKIDKEDVRAYKKYYVKDKKSGNFYLLPRRGEEKAVFYVKYNERVYFGFTPYLRLFYDESVHAGISKEHKKNILDYNKALFGFADGKKSYKSRISFDDAKVEGNPQKKNVEVLLADPKPTCIAHYLEQNKKIYSTYNQDFHIRGIKFYWLKDSVAESSDKNKVVSNEEALIKGTKLKGSISFNNLSKDELGLLLYSLCLEEGCYQQIGKAKPYGFGRINIKDVKIKIQNMSERYSSIFNNVIENIKFNEFIDYYKKYICGKLNLSDIQEDIGVRNLIDVKSNVIDNRNSVSYLPLEQFKYFNPLPTAENFLESINKPLYVNDKNAIIKKDNKQEKINKDTKGGHNIKQKNNANKKEKRKDTHNYESGFGNSMADAFKNFKIDKE